jgi:hypothetical protein
MNQTLVTPRQRVTLLLFPLSLANTLYLGIIYMLVSFCNC